MCPLIFVLLNKIQYIFDTTFFEIMQIYFVAGFLMLVKRTCKRQKKEEEVDVGWLFWA